MHIFLNISHGGYLLNTTLEVPCVRFSVAGLDQAKVGFFSFVCLFVCLCFLFIVVIVILILLQTAF